MSEQLFEKQFPFLQTRTYIIMLFLFIHTFCFVERLLLPIIHLTSLLFKRFRCIYKNQIHNLYNNQFCLPKRICLHRPVKHNAIFNFRRNFFFFYKDMKLNITNWSNAIVWNKKVYSIEKNILIAWDVKNFIRLE